MRILVTGGAGFRPGHLTDTEKAYIAGFFDGEGCVRIGTTGKGRWTVLKCVVSQKDKAPLEAMQDAFGGSIHLKKGTTIWSWNVGAKKAEAFLQAIIPYLIVKKKQVQIALMYQGTVRQHGSAPISAAEGDFRKRCMKSITDLKFKGVGVACVS